MVAVPIFGRLTASDYEDSIAKDPASINYATKFCALKTHQLHQGLSRSKKRSIANCAHGGIAGGKR
jgi:2-methylcitrate dehydratase